MIHPDLPLIDCTVTWTATSAWRPSWTWRSSHHLPLPAYTLAELRPHIQVTEPLTDIMAYFQKFHLDGLRLCRSDRLPKGGL